MVGDPDDKYPADPSPEHGNALEESAVSPEEQAEADRADIGDGTPETAPERKVPTSFMDRLRALFT
jgi:hypothetical protein